MDHTDTSQQVHRDDCTHGGGSDIHLPTSNLPSFLLGGQAGFQWGQVGNNGKNYKYFEQGNLTNYTSIFLF